AEKVYDLEAIREKLNSEKDEEKLIDTTPRESAIALGERWDNAKILSVGRNEALIELELPEHIAYDINDFCLHVSMLDNAVNAVSQKIGKGLYLPFFYKSIKVTGRMQNKFYSYIRINEKMLKGMETITFDVSLMDAKGKVFAEVTDYSIKKVNETEFQLKNARGVSNIYFQVDWINKELPADLKDLSGEKILIFKDKRGISEGLINQLENSDCSIVEVEIGSVFEKIAQDKYIINGGESDYNSLLQELAEKGITKIIHAATLTDNGEIKDLSGFKEQQKLGVFSLFNLAKALVNHKLNKELDIVLISDYAHEVSKHEAKINPHNAALLTLGKIVNLEHTNLKCRAIDIDENTSVEGILNELRAEETAYKVAYRENKRFIEEFGKLELEEDAENKVEIKDKGVYIITGGTGGLGLEMGKYIASKNNAKIAFINRSKFPERDKWDEILKDENEKKYSRAIMAIREMESLGAEVNCYSMDVINLDGMKIVLDELRAKYGVINGIIHCAGLAGNGFMMRKEKEVFESVVNPKMQGAWILDHLTENDNLDFFVVFSSILSIFGDPGQSDYASANAYLDSFAAYRQRKGKRTRAINWPAWKDTGMAVDFGIVNLENTVNPIPTSNAMSSFEEILNSKSVRALPGELNYSKILDIKESLTFKLSDKLESVLEKHRINLNQKNKSEAGDRSSTRVTIKGKDECSETENILAEIWSQVLGFDEIDIYDNFSSMGGDSLMAIQLLKNINKVFEGIIDISDIYSYPSVQQMASYIDEKLAKNNPQEEFIEENEEESLENNLNSLMDSLQSGETSLEDALSILGGELD
ncbi:MAG: type I polyketide synthase, partial [Bacillota bacterium]|nr:type I polyketide synthase [Bacillota bacterium]